MRSFDVLIGGVVAGQLVVAPSGRVGFRFSEAYRTRSSRPTLGQQFEDDLTALYPGRGRRLPPFFANLIPEGPIRGILERSLNIPAGDDVGLLAAVGADLPGAVEVRESDAEARFDVPPSARASPDEGAREEPVLRFSVAGVQMKFSVLRDAERVVIPAKGELGQWLVKLESPSHPGLVRNEYATMEWARAAGFDVPECAVRPADALPPSLRDLAVPGSDVFLIRRYDRDGLRRIHQEDFAQVAGLYPECKYGRADDGAECRTVGYEALVSVLHALGGREAYREGVRRVVLMVATGNSDAHLKNWSLLYPTPTQAVLAPLYDQVAVVAWEGDGLRWALPWGSTRGKAERVRMSTFTRLAARVGESEAKVADLVSSTLDALVASWNGAGIAHLYPEGHAESVRRYWRADGPLLRSRASDLG